MEDIMFCEGSKYSVPNHSLIVIRRDNTEMHKGRSNEIATTFMCQNCFKLFDYQEIHDRHYALKNGEKGND